MEGIRQVIKNAYGIFDTPHSKFKQNVFRLKIYLSYRPSQIWGRFLWLSLLVVIVVGCQPAPSKSPQQGRLLIWHNWNQPESAVIEDLILDYSMLYPDVQLIVEYVPNDEIQAKFLAEAETGLGPDLLLGIRSHQLYQFVEAGYLLDLQKSRSSC